MAYVVLPEPATPAASRPRVAPPRRSAPRRTSVVLGIAAGLFAAVCGCTNRKAAAPEPVVDQELLQIERAFTRVFATEPPAGYVVLAYDTDESSLPAARREEFELAEKVLTDLGIRYDKMPFEQTVTQQPSKYRADRTVPTDRIAPEMMRELAGRKVVFMHFGSEPRQQKLYPNYEAAEFGISVRRFSNPVRNR